MDGVAQLLPLLDGILRAEALCDEDGAVESDPRHHFRIGELLRASTGFPDSFVGELPDGFEMVEKQDQDAEVFFGMASHAAEGVIEGVEQFAVDVELNLIGSGVADAHGA